MGFYCLSTFRRHTGEPPDGCQTGCASLLTNVLVSLSRDLELVKSKMKGSFIYFLEEIGDPAYAPETTILLKFPLQLSSRSNKQISNLRGRIYLPGMVCPIDSYCKKNGTRKCSASRFVYDGYICVYSATTQSRNVFSLRLRVGCRILRMALASIWRTRSRVTLNTLPTSSSVRG